MLLLYRVQACWVFFPPVIEDLRVTRLCQLCFSSIGRMLLFLSLHEKKNPFCVTRIKQMERKRRRGGGSIVVEKKTNQAAGGLHHERGKHTRQS